jgi:4-azaleucine resistance transporter AzlC
MMKKYKRSFPLRTQQFARGLRAGVPVILGFVPVGIAFAIMARQAGLSIAETSLMSVTVFAGASQMMAAGMYAQGAGIAAIILTTFILNLRHVIMSTCVFTRMKRSSPAVRLPLAFGVTDESFAIFTTEKEENCTPWFFFGLILSTYLSWNAGTLIGAFVSDLLPAMLSASLGISLYAMFIGLLVPHLRGNLRLTLLVVLTAACSYLLSLVMDGSWAMILSTLFGAAVGVFFVDLGEKKEDAYES